MKVDWLISDQFTIFVEYIYQIGHSFLRFSIENSSNKGTKLTSCFIFHYSRASTLPDDLGDSKFWTVSFGLHIESEISRIIAAPNFVISCET